VPVPVSDTGTGRYWHYRSIPVPAGIHTAGTGIYRPPWLRSIVRGGRSSGVVISHAGRRAVVNQVAAPDRRRFVLPVRGARSHGDAAPHSGALAKVKEAPVPSRRCFVLPVRSASSRGAAAPHSGARAETKEAAVPARRLFVLPVSGARSHSATAPHYGARAVAKVAKVAIQAVPVCRRFVLPVGGAMSRGAAAPHSGSRVKDKEAAVSDRRRELHRPRRLHLTRGRDLTPPQRPQVAAVAHSTVRRSVVIRLPACEMAPPQTVEHCQHTWRTPMRVICCICVQVTV